jgi:16S rRNA (guanine966-N2)-methyltransferase
MSGKIHIIGGQFKGKALSVVNQQTLRPTPNRVRETLFNWLMHDIRHATCLDGFAGSGALGLEALSRGAQSVVLLEKDPVVYKQLKQTTNSFQSDAIQLVQTDFFSFLKQTTQAFNLIFLDPPFDSNLLPKCLDALSSSPALKPSGLVYLESNLPLPDPALDWEVMKTSKAGNVHFGLYKKRD